MKQALQNKKRPALILAGFTWLVLEELLGLSAPQICQAQHPVDIQKKAAEAQYWESLVEYEKMPRRKVTAEAAVAAAQSAWALSLPERADQEFDLALKDESLGATPRARIYLSKGILAHQEGRSQVAALYAQKTIEVLDSPGPLRARAWLLWGETLSAQGAYGAAREKYQAALAEAGPDDLGEINYFLGECELKLGRLEEARTFLEAVPMHHERTAQAMRLLAQTALESGRYAVAGFWLARGREDYPDSFLDSWVDYALVKVAIAEKDETRMTALRQQAAQKYPPSDPWLTLLNAAAEAYEWKNSGLAEEK